MTDTIILDEKEYEVASLSDSARNKLKLIAFSNERLRELSNVHALLQRAKDSYGDSLKKEMLNQKAGIFFDEE